MMSRVPLPRRLCFAFGQETLPRPRHLLASARSGEPSHPGEKGSSIRKYQFCHDVEVDCVASSSQFFISHQVSAFIKDGSRGQAEDQRHVFLFVIINKILHFKASFLLRKPKTLNIGFSPSIWISFH